MTQVTFYFLCGSEVDMPQNLHVYLMLGIEDAT